MKKTKYEKPHCQCGADLRFIDDLSVMASINSNGSPSRVGLFIGVTRPKKENCTLRNFLTFPFGR